MIRARAFPHHRNNHHIVLPIKHIFSDKPLNLLSCPSITETKYIMIMTFPQANIIVSSINLFKKSQSEEEEDRLRQTPRKSKKEGFQKKKIDLWSLSKSRKLGRGETRPHDQERKPRRTRPGHG
jgi:hypothetical protein